MNRLKCFKRDVWASSFSILIIVVDVVLCRRRRRYENASYYESFSFNPTHSTFNRSDSGDEWKTPENETRNPRLDAEDEKKNNWQMNLITIFKWLALVCSIF